MAYRQVFESERNQIDDAVYDSPPMYQQRPCSEPLRKIGGSYGEEQFGGRFESQFGSEYEVRPRQLPRGQVVKLSCKGNPDYSLGVRDGQVMLVYYNPSDPTQQWIKEESWSNSVRDEVGHPAFCLVNKATGQALRHAPSQCQEVLLTNYEPGSYDSAILWTESEDMGCGYRTIRMANNIGLNLDAFQGDRRHGGIREGTRAVLWKWNKQDNQLWKITPCY